MSMKRRDFLQHAGFSLGAAALAGKAEFVQADDKPQSSSPNEKLGFAIIGCGGRGGSHLDAFSSRKDTEVLYVCDVDAGHGARAQKSAKDRQGTEPKFVQDFRKALEDPAVDCISTATPNHWHSLVSILALQAGKHVYVEKPVSHNVWEGRQMVLWARHENLMCQAGTQSRSSPSLHEAVKYVREGNLGKIQYAIGTCFKPRKSIGKLDKPLSIPDSIDYDLWCGPAAKVDLYRPKLHYDWHWDYNTGNGDMGNQGIHQMDIARWFLGEQTVSPRILSIGGRLGYDDAGDTANTQVVVHDYEAAPLYFETRGLPKANLDWGTGMDNYRGSQIGVIVQCEQGYVVIPSYSSATAFDNDGKQVAKWGGGGDHFGNFVEGVRANDHKVLNGDILEGHLSSALCHTGGVSHVLGRKATVADVMQALGDDKQLVDSVDRMCAHLLSNGVDVTKEAILTLGADLKMNTSNESFIDNPTASPLLTRPYRDGFVVPSGEKLAKA
ncbi:MAG: Gfo/Idh/MocA family oxidoreductase [Planctomycetaceae bacterium]